MPLERWLKGGRTAFGGGAEKNGEGVLLMFGTQARRLEATLVVPRTLTVGGSFVNFYVGFNTVGDGGTPIVEAGVSLSAKTDYSPHPPAGHVTNHVVMHRSNVFQNPHNTQAGPLYWNVFINSAMDGTSSNMPASGDLRGQTILLVLDISGGRISFRAGAIATVPLPFKHHVRIGHAKMIAAMADATTSSFSAATMRMDRLDGKAPHSGRAWRVNGAANSQTLDATVGPIAFTCATAAGAAKAGR